MLIRGYKLLCMYVCRIPVKLDRNAFRSATEVGFQPVEKAEHQGCCGRIPTESGRNRNPALDSGTQKNGPKAGMCNLAFDTATTAKTILTSTVFPIMHWEGTTFPSFTPHPH